MTGDDPWSGWAADWRAAPQETPDFDALERRIRRRRDLRLLHGAADIAACLLAGSVSVWMLASGRADTIIVGLAGLAFSLFGLAVALGRRRIPRELESRTVAGALAWEIASARAWIRTSIGGLMTAAGALVFLLVCAIVYRESGMLTRPMSNSYILIGGALFALASGAASLVLLRRRKARLRTLERLLADLKDEEA